MVEIKWGGLSVLSPVYPTVTLSVQFVLLRGLKMFILTKNVNVCFDASTLKTESGNLRVPGRPGPTTPVKEDEKVDNFYLRLCSYAFELHPTRVLSSPKKLSTNL